MFALESAAQWHRLGGMQGDPERERSDGKGWWSYLRWVLRALLWVTGILVLLTFILGLACLALVKFG